MGGLHGDMEWDPDEEESPMVGLNKMLEDEAQALRDIYDQTFVNTDVDWDRFEATHKCLHKWAQYQGLNEKYEFCEKCDVKK
jgi:hypothetical protein